MRSGACPRSQGEPVLGWGTEVYTHLSCVEHLVLWCGNLLQEPLGALAHSKALSLSGVFVTPLKSLCSFSPLIGLPREILRPEIYCVFIEIL